ncbi:MAG: MFS transporter [Fusobacteriaceae bacterium]|jgi:MFS family permease|nr:MFS transporter [Fusobacteriaceae bacterium]
MFKNLMGDLKKKEAKSWYMVSVATFYFMYGLIFATWVSRISDIKIALNINDIVLGGILAFIPAGQMVAMAISGLLVSKFGSKKILIIGGLSYGTILALIGLISSLWRLSLGLFFFGMAANMLNIAVNTQGVGVERIFKKSILGTFNGFWSLGGLLGGIISAFIVSVNPKYLFHFVIICLFSIVIVTTMSWSVLPRDEYNSNKVPNSKEKKKIFSRPDKYILILGLIAFCSMASESAVYDWGTIYFKEVINPPQNLLRLGYIATMLSMTGGRFYSDKFIMRFGAETILKTCGILITCGILSATIFPNLVAATFGFFLVGLGVSAVVPISFSLAGKSKIMLPGMSIATVSFIGFFGYLLTPPILGFLADKLSLRWTLAIFSTIGLLVYFLSKKIQNNN